MIQHIKKYAGVVLLGLISHVVQASPFGIEARSLAMGNVSVATADIAAASFANPAMLAFQRSDTDFALLLPAVGAYIDDSDGVIDLIDQYQAAEDAGDQNAQVTAARALFDKTIAPQGSLATSIGLSGERFSFAISARADVLFAGGVTDPAQNVAELSDPAKNLLNLTGVGTTEVGISIATNLNLMGHKLAIGITPKVISVELLTYSESLSSVNTGASDLLDENNIADLGSFTTLDAGAAFEISDNIQIGLVARNLLSGDLNQGGTAVKFDTQLRAGVAYNGDFFRLGADIDLSENDSVLSLLPEMKSRMLSIGAEFNAFDFAQLRIGMQKNLASGISEAAKQNLLTAGIGFWFGFHLDIAAAMADDVLGVFVQTGFRF
jgi:hypothetical protein